MRTLLSGRNAPVGPSIPAILPHMATLIGRSVPLAVCATLIAGPALPANYPIQAVPFTKVRLQDRFWAPRIATNRTVTIPFGFRKSEDEGRVRNFERAAG